MLMLQYHEKNLDTATLFLADFRNPGVCTQDHYVIRITGQLEPERQRVADFIKAIYEKNYNADIHVDYPFLMSINNNDDNILAALGFRYAENHSLFLEHYIDKPIENILGCPRHEIVEIGNLASAGQGALNLLFAAAASYLNSRYIHYAAITGTDSLHRYFKNMGFNPSKIGNADIASVQKDGQSWGSYYDTQPRVLVGSIETAVNRFKTLLGADFVDCRPRLLPRFHNKQIEVAA